MTTPSSPDVEIFRADLRELYVAAGKPSPQVMARASGRTPGLFGFLNASGLPAWDQVTALLTATGNHAPETVARWRRRWARLEGQHRRLVPDGRSAPGSAALLRESGGEHQTGPVNQALAAANPAEFAAALNQLRLAAGMSYGEIARRKKGILSKSAAHRMATTEDILPLRREALTAFVRACGGTEHDASAWWAIAARIRRGDPPVALSRELSAAGLLQQHRPPEPWLARYTMTDAGTEAVRLRAENEQLRADNERMRQALDTTVRAFRTVDAERAELRQQLAALTVTVDGKTNIRSRIMLSPRTSPQPGTYAAAGPGRARNTG